MTVFKNFENSRKINYRYVVESGMCGFLCSPLNCREMSYKFTYWSEPSENTAYCPYDIALYSVITRANQMFRAHSPQP